MEKKKPGRPTKDVTRSKQVHVRMYEDEYEKIKTKADELGLSVSTFMVIAARDFWYKN